jgi:hypothetical protein
MRTPGMATTPRSGPGSGAGSNGAARPRVTGADLLAVVLSLTPVGVLIAVAADPDVTRLVGFSALGWVIGFTLAWAALGVFAVAQTRSPLTRSVAFLVFTIPATVVAVVGPWIPLIL